MSILDVLKSGQYLVLDTETTGLDAFSEICQIAIINADGDVLMDRFVKPVRPIPPDATRIHGITNAMVKDSDPFPIEDVAKLLNGKHVIIYNKSYDVSMLYRSESALIEAGKWSKQATVWQSIAQFHCAMLQFAEIYGDWNHRYKNYKWKPLDVACSFYGVTNPSAHSALGDCLATLAVCKAMVGDLNK